MEIAFYKGPGDIVTFLIRKITRSSYSHAKIRFFDGLVFQASGRKPAGISLRPWKEETKCYWDAVKIPLTFDEELSVLRYSQKFIGGRFSWRGVFRFLFPWMAEDEDGWYCTELIVHILQETLGMLRDVHVELTPQELYEKLLTCSRSRDTMMYRY